MSDQIGPYKIRRVLGQGGMGVVYEAEEALSGRRVALKMLAPERARDEHARTLFRNEIQFLAHLDHPNLVRSLAAQEIEGQMVLVLEFLQGQTLREILNERGRLPWAEAAGHAATLASALGALHQASPPILHRDLKPENVVRLADGRLKLLDLGIAKAFSADETTSTQGLGTLLYMSPEQIDGKPLDPRSDLYSLGLLLFELLTGHPPFHGGSPRELMGQQCTAQPALDPEIRREVPRGIEQLLLRMLAKSPADRPATARDVISGLEAFLPTEGALPVSAPAPRSGPVRTSLVSAIPTAIAAPPSTQPLTAPSTQPSEAPSTQPSGPPSALSAVPSTQPYAQPTTPSPTLHSAGAPASPPTPSSAIPSEPAPRSGLLDQEIANPLAVLVLIVVSVLTALAAAVVRLASLSSGRRPSGKRRAWWERPVDGGISARLQVAVGGREVTAAQEAHVRRERGGVRRAQHVVTTRVDELTFALGVRAPQHEDHALALAVERRNGSVGEALPAAVLVGRRAAPLHREHAVEQQHAAVGPRQQAAVIGARDRQVSLDLLEDILERGRDRNARAHGEAQAVRLARPVVGVLPEDHDAHGVERRARKRGKDLRAWGENLFPALFFCAQELAERLHIRSTKIVAHALLPAWLQLEGAPPGACPLGRLLGPLSWWRFVLHGPAG